MYYRTTLQLLWVFLFIPVLSFAQKQYTIKDISNILKANQHVLKLEATDFSEFDISSQYTDAHNGLTHIYLQQKHRGLSIDGALLGIHLNAEGEAVHFANRFFPHKNSHIRFVSPSISAEAALEEACRHLKIEPDKISVVENSREGENKLAFDKGNFSIYDVPAELVLHRRQDNSLAAAWKVEIYTTDEQHYWVIKVDARDGKVVELTDLVISCTFGPEHHGHAAHATRLSEKFPAPAIPSAGNAFESMLTGGNYYRVYDRPVEAPTFGSRSLVLSGGDPAASPLGWHNDGITQHFITRGNNVAAYVDPGPASTPIYTLGGLPGQQPLVFDFDIDFNQMPTLYKDASVTNLFYWNNLIHDIFYHYGFTEAAGNFQQNNLNRGGEGLDAVLAEAQDGSGVDNANFLTLRDGLPGRMQMFLWSTNIPLLDGDLDNGVIAHEYGHGISTRLTGGPMATCLGGDEQGGEGWSDYFGLMLTMNSSNLSSGFTAGRGIGTYVLAESPNGDGIRPARYSTDFAVNDYTYADIDNSNISAPHGVGFIWCTMLWEMTNNLVETYGFDPDIYHGTGGNNIALQLVVDGIKLQPCSPTFVEMRDAILAADQINNGGANQCLIWEAFAKRGLGFSASSGSNARGDEVEAFDLPPSSCQPAIQARSIAESVVNDGSTTAITIELTNNSNNNINHVTVNNYLPAGYSFVSASRNANVNNGRVRFNNVSVPANSTTAIQINAQVNTGSQGTLQLFDDMENGPFNWTATYGLNQFVWTSTDAYSGSYSWFAVDPDNPSEQILTLNQDIDVQSGMLLQFTHRFRTEATFDAGVVEMSTDGGLTWTNIGPLMTANGYNDNIPLGNNPSISGFAFGGDSNGFLTTRANLSPLAGNTARLRFRFSSDIASGGEGWYIDDVVLASNPNIVTNTVDFSLANGAATGQASSSSVVVAGGAQRPGPGKTVAAPQHREPAAGVIAMDIYPNPAHALATLSLRGLADGQVSISVQNLHGQEIFRQEKPAEAGFFQMELNTSGWPSGMYLVRAQQNGAAQVQKLVIK